MANKTNRIELTIDIFDARQQIARAKPTLTSDELVAAILEEFRGDQDQIYLGAPAASYCLLRAASGQALADGRALSDQGLASGERLVLAERTPAQPAGATAPSRPTYLRDLATAAVYRLHWLPALIGRPGSRLTDNDRLAVNLSEHPQWTRVSRRHARIAEERGQLTIECLADENPIVVRDARGQATQLPPHRRHGLHDRDTIELTNSGIKLQVLVRSQSS